MDKPLCFTKFPNVDFSIAYKNLNLTILDPDSYDVCYQVRHDVLPVNDRMYRHGAVCSKGV